MPLFEDSRIDAIVITPKRLLTPPRLPVEVATGEDLKPIQHLLGSVSCSHLDLFAHQMVNSYGFGIESGEIVFPDAAVYEPDIEPFEGVMFVDFFEHRVNMSEGAFRRLMDRLFTALIDFVAERKLDVSDESCWQEFLQHAGHMRQLANKIR